MVICAGALQEVHLDSARGERPAIVGFLTDVGKTRGGGDIRKSLSFRPAPLGILGMITLLSAEGSRH